MAQSSYKKQRREEAIRESKQRKARNLVLATVAAVVIVIVFVLVYQKSQNGQPQAGQAGVVAASTFELDKQPMLGSANAPVTIVEFGDFKCPICKRFAEEVLPNLQKDYVDKGVAKLYFINYPFIGPDSTTAAMAVESVYKQKKDAAWPYLEAIYHNQQDEKKVWATEQNLVDIAKGANLGIDPDKLLSDLKNGTYKNEVNNDLHIVNQLKLDGTPTVYINGKEIELQTLFTYDQLKAIIDAAAKGANG